MHTPAAPPSPGRRFQTVASVARLLDVSEVTIYRAIQAGQFPAIKVRGRYVIPTSALDAMEAAALSSGTVIDTADWDRERSADGLPHDRVDDAGAAGARATSGLLGGGLR